MRHGRILSQRAGIRPQGIRQKRCRPQGVADIHQRHREEAAAASAGDHEPDLHDVEVPQVWHDNALTRRPYKDYDEADQVDVILTNPPFGGMEEPGVEQNFPTNFQTKETADLFLALIVKLLKDGGKGAVVLPDGSLFGEGVKTRL